MICEVCKEAADWREGWRHAFCLDCDCQHKTDRDYINREKVKVSGNRAEESH